MPDLDRFSPAWVHVGSRVLRPVTPGAWRTGLRLLLTHVPEAVGPYLKLSPPDAERLSPAIYAALATVPDAAVRLQVLRWAPLVDSARHERAKARPDVGFDRWVPGDDRTVVAALRPPPTLATYADARIAPALLEVLITWTEAARDVGMGVQSFDVMDSLRDRLVAMRAAIPVPLPLSPPARIPRR
jgi:hypothetical protein